MTLRAASVRFAQVTSYSLYEWATPRWSSQAACLSRPLARFFPEDRKTEGERESTTFQAKTVCFGCAVRAQCLEWAMTVEAGDEARYQAEDGDNVSPLPGGPRYRVGVFGGLDPKERVKAHDEGWTVAEALLKSDLQVLGPTRQEEAV